MTEHPTASASGTGPAAEEPSSAPGVVAAVDGPTSQRRPTWRVLFSNPVTVASAVVLVLVVAVALFGRFIVPYGLNATDVTNALQPPSAAHLFGTDDLGRDVFSRVIASTEVSLLVAVVSVAVALLLGVSIGVLSGYARGIVDNVLMRIVDVLFAFPVVLLALVIVAILGAGMWTTMLAVGIVYTPIFARISRASTLSVSVEPYVQVSRTMGTGHWYILTRHVLPNIAAPVIVQTSLSLAFAILTEATLSFLGMGIQPPSPSWGRMIFDAQSWLDLAWWMALFPGAAIFVTVLAFNLFGDGLRDVMDPKQRSLMEARMK
jgi:peptide/nickel transport system permease protein